MPEEMKDKKPLKVKHNINPQITTVVYGVRDLKELTIYPLSIFQQKEMTEVIAKAVEQVGTLQTEGEDRIDNPEFIKLAVELVEENLIKLLDLVTDNGVEPASLLDDMTNDQAGDIALVIFEVNYEGLIKKVTDLLNRMGASPLGRLLQVSANDMDIASMTSSIEDSEMEE